MAEGLLRHLSGDCFEAFSAGTEATRVRLLATMAMEEICIDISGQESKTLDRYLNQPFDYVITVCDDANEACPFFPGPRAGCTGPSRTLAGRGLRGGALGGLPFGKGPDRGASASGTGERRRIVRAARRVGRTAAPRNRAPQTPTSQR